MQPIRKHTRTGIAGRILSGVTLGSPDLHDPQRKVR